MDDYRCDGCGGVLAPYHDRVFERRFACGPTAALCNSCHNRIDLEVVASAEFLTYRHAQDEIDSWDKSRAGSAPDEESRRKERDLRGAAVAATLALYRLILGKLPYQHSASHADAMKSGQ